VADNNLLAYLLVGGGFVAVSEILKSLITHFTSRQTTRSKVSGDARDDKRDDFDTVTNRLEKYVERLEKRITSLETDLESERTKRRAAEAQIAVLDGRVGRLMFFADSIHAVIMRDCDNAKECPLWPLLSNPAMDRLPLFAAAQAEKIAKEGEGHG
jgi:hypothetical protein